MESKGDLIRNAIVGVPKTAIWVAVFRCLLTNHYVNCISNRIRKENTQEDVNAKDIIAMSSSHPYYKVQQEYIDTCYLPTLDQRDVTVETIGIYDPYAYFISSHPLSVELLFETVSERIISNHQKQKETIGNGSRTESLSPQSIIDGIRDKLNTSNPLESWKKFSPASIMNNVGKRTMYIDQLLYKHVINPGNPAQVVILGSGLDCRPLRLPFTDKVSIFEIDLPEMIEFKQMILSESIKSIPPQSKSKNCRFSADLTNPEIWPKKLLEMGFNGSIPTFWIAEGLFMYLPDGIPQNIMSTIYSISAPGSMVLYQTLVSFSLSLLTPDSPELTIIKLFKSSTSTPADYAKNAGFNFIETLNYKDIDKQFNIVDPNPDKELISQFSLASK